MMNYIKLYSFKIFIIVLFINPHVHSSIKNSIIAKVGDQIITSYELENKIKTTLVLSKEQINQKNIDKIKNLSLNNLINTKLKDSELSKYNLKVNQLAVSQQLKNISMKLGIQELELKSFFKENNIDYEKYIREIETEFLWQKLIFQIYSKKIVINENEIISELNEFIKNKKKIDEFHLAEIEVFFDSQNEKVKLIKQIKDTIDQFGFDSAANKFSISSSSISGGDIGWVSSTGLSEKILNILKDLKPGEITEPLTQVNKIIFLKLLEKRSVENNQKLDFEKLKISLINKKKNELLNLYSNNHLSKKRNSTLINLQ